MHVKAPCGYCEIGKRHATPILSVMNVKQGQESQKKKFSHMTATGKQRIRSGNRGEQQNLTGQRDRIRTSSYLPRLTIFVDFGLKVLKDGGIHHFQPPRMSAIIGHALIIRHRSGDDGLTILGKDK